MAESEVPAEGAARGPRPSGVVVEGGGGRVPSPGSGAPGLSGKRQSWSAEAGPERSQSGEGAVPGPPLPNYPGPSHPRGPGALRVSQCPSLLGKAGGWGDGQAHSGAGRVRGLPAAPAQDGSSSRHPQRAQSQLFTSVPWDPGQQARPTPLHPGLRHRMTPGRLSGQPTPECNPESGSHAGGGSQGPGRGAALRPQPREGAAGCRGRICTSLVRPLGTQWLPRGQPTLLSQAPPPVLFSRLRGPH